MKRILLILLSVLVVFAFVLPCLATTSDDTSPPPEIKTAASIDITDIQMGSSQTMASKVTLEQAGRAPTQDKGAIFASPAEPSFFIAANEGKIISKDINSFVV